MRKYFVTIQLNMLDNLAVSLPGNKETVAAKLHDFGFAKALITSTTDSNV
jgi:hypothetical protein